MQTITTTEVKVLRDCAGGACFGFGLEWASGDEGGGGEGGVRLRRALLRGLGKG